MSKHYVEMNTLPKSLSAADKNLNPDKMANISLILGIFAVLLLLFPSYTLVLEIPAGVLAIRYGRQAIKKRTGKKIKAISGQVLGLIVLTSLIVEIILVILLLVVRYYWA